MDCENSFREHHCRGPLFQVKHNREKKIYCFESIKRFIRVGDDIDMIKGVPRMKILKKGRTKYLSFFRDDENVSRINI